MSDDLDKDFLVGGVSNASISGTGALKPAKKETADNRSARRAKAKGLRVVKDEEAEADFAPTKRRQDVTDWAEATDWLRAEMGRRELSCIFRRGSELVTVSMIGKDGYREPTVKERLAGVEFGPATVAPLDVNRVRALVDSRYQSVKTVKSGKQIRVMFPTQPVISAFAAAQINEDTPNIRPLNGVTHTPLIRRDGSILARPGYDDATGLLYMPDPALDAAAVLRLVPEAPTAAEVKEAAKLIAEPFAEFPYVTAEHRINALMAVFVPALRAYIPGPYPGWIYTATNAGSGKGYHAKVMDALYGYTVRHWPAEPEEQRKSVYGLLHTTTAPVAVFDNMVGVFRSSMMEHVLTTLRVDGRQLGATKDLRLVNDRMWMFNGNNIKIGGDLARRLVPVALDPPEANWHLKTFRLHPVRWVEERRARYLAAVLTVIRGWIAAGATLGRGGGSDYGTIVSALRGLATFAGYTEAEFWASDVNAAAAIEDTDADDLARVLEYLYDCFGTEPFTIRQICGRVMDEADAGTSNMKGKIPLSVMPGKLPEIYARNDGATAGFARTLGIWMSNWKGRYAHGWRAEKLEPATRSKKEEARFQITLHPDE